MAKKKSTPTFYAKGEGCKSPKREGWYETYGTPGKGNPFYVNFDAKNGPGNCTWYAYGRYCECAGKWIPMTRYPDAVNFWNSFPNYIKRGSTPKLGAIICFGYYMSVGTPGHVAVVEKIYENGDIGTSESGWSSGWIGYRRRSKSNNYQISGYGEVFRGFIYNPVDFDPDNVATYTGDGSAVDSALNVIDTARDEAISRVEMQKRASQLYTSNNYEFTDLKAQKEAEERAATKKAILQTIKNAIDSVGKAVDNVTESDEDTSNNVKVVADSILKAINEGIKKLEKTNYNINRKVNSIFDVSRYLVESPFVTVKIGGITLGNYGSKFDKYPNYINSLNITKTNGSINEYEIQLVHQIRVGDDPNRLDKLLSKNQFNKITITYGDSSSGGTFEDTEAIITNVNMTRDYASSRITYTISATSAGNYVTSHKMNFPKFKGKPSERIFWLLYESPASEELKKAFPGMASRSEVASRGLIPTNDRPVSIQQKVGIDPITYLNYLVSCMSNASDKNPILKNSTYFIYYRDKEGKSDFQIKEVKKEDASNNYNAVYEVTVGYPDDNNIFSFDVSNEKGWAIMYNKTLSSVSDEYVYTIENNGDTKRIYSPTLEKTTQRLSVYDSNWWSYMVGFPITATLTMRGLLRPAFLTNYIKINVVFYGQKHITSGLYTITEQKDTLSGGGFRTTFSLVRVGDD